MANKLTKQEATNISYIFPKSEEIVIHKSDLQIQLENFKKRILASFSIFDLLAIVSLWAPIFSTDFKKILSLEPSEVKVGYTVFAVLITIFILLSRTKYFIIEFRKRNNVSSDSEQMAIKILEKCQSKEK